MSTNKMCRIHNLQKAQFYILNQPWNRLCKQCALSRALCGYKIEKELNSQEFQNKIVFNALVQELRNIIQMCDKKSQQYSTYIDELSANIRSFLSQPLNEIDQYIKKIVKIRDQILNVNLNYVDTQMKKLKDTQTNYFIESIKFKKLLQKLQGTFCQTITEPNKLKDEQIFNKQIADIRLEIQNSKDLLYQSQYKKVDVEFEFNLIKIQFEKIFKQFQLVTNQNKFCYFKNKDEQKIQLKVLLTSKDLNNLTKDSMQKSKSFLARTSTIQLKRLKKSTNQQNNESTSKLNHKPLTLRKTSSKKLINKNSIVYQ